MSGDNTQGINVKMISGAAANVMTIVSETVGSINEYAQKANKAASEMMVSALWSGFAGSVAGMLGGFSTSLGELSQSATSFALGKDSLAKGAELKGIRDTKEAALRPLKAGRDVDFENIKNHPAMASGSEGEGSVEAVKEVPTESKMADDRTSLSYHNSKIETAENAASTEEKLIEEKYTSSSQKIQGFQGVGRALGTIGKTIGEMVQSINKGTESTLQGLAQSTQQTVSGSMSLANQLLSTASNLYAGLRG
ncbi:MAG: hypothetical protein ChlgKO_06790 [Chlamydiales bacterium]